jgi:hypothetical protein
MWNLIARTDWMLLKSIFQRSQVTRILKFSNMGLLPDSKEGVRGANFVTVTWTKSKTNLYGKTQQVVFLRHKCLTECAVSALGFMWLLRYQAANNPAPWPCFSRRETW